MELVFSNDAGIKNVEKIICLELLKIASKMQTDIIEMIDLRIKLNEFLNQIDTVYSYSFDDKIIKKMKTAFGLTAIGPGAIIMRPEVWEVEGIHILKQIASIKD